MKKILSFLFLMVIFSVIAFGFVKANTTTFDICSCWSCNDCHPPAPVNCYFEEIGGDYTTCSAWCALNTCN